MTDFLHFETFRRSPRPNDYLVAPPGLTSAKVDRVAPEFSKSADILFEKISACLEQDGGYQNIATDPAQSSIRAVAVTPLLRFKDDVHIRVLATDTGCTLAAYSRSRIGGGDLGANRRRLEKLIGQLHEWSVG